MQTRLVYVNGAYCYNVTMLQCYIFVFFVEICFLPCRYACSLFVYVDGAYCYNVTMLQCYILSFCRNLNFPPAGMHCSFGICRRGGGLTLANSRARET